MRLDLLGGDTVGVSTEVLLNVRAPDAVPCRHTGQDAIQNEDRATLGDTRNLASHTVARTTLNGGLDVGWQIGTHRSAPFVSGGWG